MRGIRADRHHRVGIVAAVALSLVGVLPSSAAPKKPAVAGEERAEPARDRHHAKGHESSPGRVILPSAGPAISAAMDGARPAITSFDASIQRVEVKGKACQQKRCWDFDLSDPEGPCEGAALPVFCLRWRGEHPPTEVALAMAAAVQSLDPDAVWSVPPGRPLEEGRALWLALGLALGALLIGLVVGLLLRKLLPCHPGIRAFLALVVGAIGAAGVIAWSLKDVPHPTATDGVSLGIVVFLGGWLGGLKLPDPKLAWLGVLGAVVGVVGAELALRQTVPERPECWHAKEVRLLQPSMSDRKCRGAFAVEDDAFFKLASIRAKDAPALVVHVGDSMIFGSGIDFNETVVARLDASDKARAHVNLGNPDTGPDHQLLTLWRWLGQHRSAAVVAHLYTGNDLVDLDRPDPCCGGTSLLRYTEQGPVGRCKAPVWQPDVAHTLVAGAPPFVLQVAAQRSHLGAMACAALRPTTAAAGAALGAIAVNADGPPSTDKHLAAVLQAMKKAAFEHGATFDLVLLPERDGLEAPIPASSPARKRADRVLAIAKKHGVRAHDAWPMVQAFLSKNGAKATFAQAHARDFHYSARAHAALATWLQMKLHLEAETDAQQKP